MFENELVKIIVDGHQIHKTQTRPTHPAIESLLISDDEGMLRLGLRLASYERTGCFVFILARQLV